MDQSDHLGILIEFDNPRIFRPPKALMEGYTSSRFFTKIDGQVFEARSNFKVDEFHKHMKILG